MATHMRVEYVDAREATPGEQIVTRNGIVYLQEGQWVVTPENGGPARVVDGDVFEEEYAKYVESSDKKSSDKRPAAKRN